MPCTRKLARPCELRGLLLEHADELGADQLALGLGVAHAREALEEALLGVDGDQRHLEGVAERGDHLLALVLAHQAVVDEHAGQPVADRAVHEQRGDRGVDAAGEAADRPAVADLRADPRDLLLDRPSAALQVALAAADLGQEAASGSPGRTACGRPRGGTGSRRSPRSRVLERGDRRARSRTASAVKPGGGSKTVSRWDIQQVCSRGQCRASSRPRLATTSARERPNSPTSARSTRPPSACASSCMP